MTRSIRALQSFGAPRATTNPYIVMLARALADTDGVRPVSFSWPRALFGSYDLIHIQWPEALLAARTPLRRRGKRLAFTLLLARARMTRTPIVRTVHNLAAHEPNRRTAALLGALDVQTTLRIRINAATPVPESLPSELIVHGHYRDWFAAMPRRTAVPGRIAYLGLIRPYKGVEDLVSAYAGAARRDPGLSIVIAGQPRSDELAAELHRLAATVSGITLVLHYVPEEEFAAIVSESEIVALPYRQMHNSGVALAVLSLNRPVLVPRSAENEALAEEVGPGWVHFFDDRLDEDSLLAAVHEARRRAPTLAEPALENRRWDDVGAAHLRCYRRALSLQSASRNPTAA